METNRVDIHFANGHGETMCNLNGARMKELKRG